MDDRCLGVGLVHDSAPPWPEGLSIKKLSLVPNRFGRRLELIWSRASVRVRLVHVRSLLSRPQRGALQCCVHHTDLPPQHRPEDQKDASHLSGNAIATAYSIAAPALAVARPPPNPHTLKSPHPSG